MLRSLFFLIPLGIWTSGAMGQDSAQVYVLVLPQNIAAGDATVPQDAPVFSPDKSVRDSASLYRYLSDYRMDLVRAGYLASSIDRVESLGDTTEIHLHLGRRYAWASLGKGNVPEEILSEVRFRERLYTGRPLDPSKLSVLMESVLEHMASTGYPFSRIGLDSIRIEADGVRAQLHLEKNQYTVIDSIVIKGEVKTDRAFLQNYLGLKKSRAYDEKLLEKIPSRVRELPFVSAIKPFEIGMRPGKADIYLYLEPKKASHFDGVLGLLPDESTGDILVTGDVELNLMNALHHGETIGLHWQRLQSRTQELEAHFAYPFLLGTPLGINLSFSLYRKDTLFAQNKFRAGADYYFLGNDKVSIFVENTASNILSDESASGDLYANSDIFMVGLGVDIGELDYRFNPRSGYFLKATLATGKKTTRPMRQPEDPEPHSNSEKSDIYNANCEGGYFFGMGKRSTLLARVRGGALVNNELYRNESYRLGGLKTLRGFDEQSIFASLYAVATLEYRFILERNSNLFVFFDQGAYEDRLRSSTLSDTPFGFGTGVNFETGPGVFSLTYALGRQFDNRISLKSGKIHFGFISFF